jgi:hypothetical protein
MICIYCGLICIIFGKQRAQFQTAVYRGKKVTNFCFLNTLAYMYMCIVESR